MRALLAALFLALPGCSRAPAAPPPVVLVILDSVRADRLGAYGSARPAPRFDRLAREGVLFERAYAGSSAGIQSLATLWTGRLPSRGGHLGLAEAAPHPELDTLPRLFRRAGYRTALVSNHPGLRARTFTRGFDDVEVDSEPGRWDAAFTVARARELLGPAEAAEHDAPLFLVLVLADASEPYLPPAEHRARIDVPPCAPPLSLAELRAAAGALPEGVRETPGFRDLVARYEAEVAAVDAGLGALVDALAERGMLDETLLVVTSSHGTEFLEHGWVGHGWTLHEEVLRVPLLVRFPRALVPSRVAEPVSLADLAPSLAVLAGLPGPRHGSDGVALFEPGDGRLVPCAGHPPVIAELVVPELVVERAAIHDGRMLVEVLVTSPPGERLERLATLEARLASIQAGETSATPTWGAPLRRELHELGRAPGASEDASSAFDPAPLAAWLEEYAATCRRDGLEPPSTLRRAPEPEAADTSLLQQIGYL